MEIVTFESLGEILKELTLAHRVALEYHLVPGKEEVNACFEFEKRVPKAELETILESNKGKDSTKLETELKQVNNMLADLALAEALKQKSTRVVNPKTIILGFNQFQVELANAQLIGFGHASKGYSIKELAEAMAMTAEECELLLDNPYLTDAQKAELGSCFPQ